MITQPVILTDADGHEWKGYEVAGTFVAQFVKCSECRRGVEGGSVFYVALGASHAYRCEKHRPIAA